MITDDNKNDQIQYNNSKVICSTNKFKNYESSGIFVQGTLRIIDHKWDLFNENTKYFPAIIRGYKMYKSKNRFFPQIIKTSNNCDIIQGDFIIFEQSEEFVRNIYKCDEIEGFNPDEKDIKNNFYNRVIEKVELQDSGRKNIIETKLGQVQSKRKHMKNQKIITSGSWHQFNSHDFY